MVETGPSAKSVLEQIEETDEANALLNDGDEEDDMFKPLFARRLSVGNSQDVDTSSKKTWSHILSRNIDISNCPQIKRRRSLSSGDIDFAAAETDRGDRENRTPRKNTTSSSEQSTSRTESTEEPSTMRLSNEDQKPSPFLTNALYASGGLYNSAKNGPRLRRSFMTNQFADPSGNMPLGKTLSDSGDLEEVQKESKQLTAAGRPRGPSAIAISLSEAKQRLFNHTLSGVMLKRGFGGFRAWRWRHVVLCGRMLSYFTHHPENDPGQKQMPRGQLEIHKMTRVRMIEANHSVLPAKNLLPLTARSADAQWYGFEIIPVKSQVAACKKGKWMLCVSSAKERQNWIDALVASMRLIERTEEPATLRGLGKVFDHFHVRGVLGKGRFGVVRLIHHRPTGQPYALKEINKSRKNFKAARESIRNELKVLRRLKLRLGSHPYICSTYEVYEDQSKIRIVMEFLGGGDLFDSISARGKYGETSASAIIQRLIKAAKALHTMGIIHRDIKPENVLFTGSSSIRETAAAMHSPEESKSDGEGAASPLSASPRSPPSASPRSPRSVSARAIDEDHADNENVKIADFGCSLLLKREKGTWVPNPADVKENDLIGTPGYIAPEVLFSCHYTPACDVFAIGVILYIMLVGYPPFWGDDDEEVFDKTRRGDYSFYRKDWENISSSARKLCAAMMEKDPANRITTAQALQHPWIQSPPSNPIPSTQMRLTKLNELRKHKNDATRESLEGASSPRSCGSPTDSPSVGIKRRTSFKSSGAGSEVSRSAPVPIETKRLPLESPGIQRIGSTSYSDSAISDIRAFSFPSSVHSMDKLMSRSANSSPSDGPPGLSVSHGTPKQLEGVESLFG